jgi:hypothetical protein
MGYFLATDHQPKLIQPVAPKLVLILLLLKLRLSLLRFCFSFPSLRLKIFTEQIIN